MNKAILIGRAVKDTELRYIASGKALAKLTLAVDRRDEQADFIPIVAWGKLAETCAQYVGKGSQVAVEGEIRVSSWETEAGERRQKTEIVASSVKFLDLRGGGNKNI